MARRLVLAALALSAVSLASARPLRFRVAIDAGRVERVESPVTVRLAVGKELTADDVRQLHPFAAAWIEREGEPDSRRACQAEPVRDTEGRTTALDVFWVIPRLAAGSWKSYVVTLEAAAAGSGTGFRFTEGDGWRDLTYSGRPVWRHVWTYDPARREETYKPFWHLYAVDAAGPGADFITKGPGGYYTHHRGLFIGWRDVEAAGKHYDFWHCPDVAIRHKKFLFDRDAAGPVLARSAAANEWTGQDGQAVVRETREVTAWRGGDGELIMDFAFALEAASAPVRLGGDAQHAGFHFRAAQEVADRKDAQYLRPATARSLGDDIWADCPWAAGCFEVGKRSYTVLHLDHPSNPRPMTYSTRDYGRFGSFFTASINPGTPLELRYRVIVRPDHAPAEWCERTYADWLTPASVAVERLL